MDPRGRMAENKSTKPPRRDLFSTEGTGNFSKAYGNNLKPSAELNLPVKTSTRRRAALLLGAPDGRAPPTVRSPRVSRDSVSAQSQRYMKKIVLFFLNQLE